MSLQPGENKKEVRMLKNFTDTASGIITIYMFIIVIRIVLTWFQPGYSSNPNSIITKLTDPYLNFFRRMGFVIGHLDFSPILAIVTLVILSTIFMQIGIYGKITAGIILSIILTSVWSALASLLTFFILIIVIRLFMLFFKSNTFSPLTSSLDSLLVPLSSYVAAIFIKESASSYQTNLIILVVLALVIRLFVPFIVAFLSGIFISLPF